MQRVLIKENLLSFSLEKKTDIVWQSTNQKIQLLQAEDQVTAGGVHATTTAWKPNS